MGKLQKIAINCKMRKIADLNPPPPCCWPGPFTSSQLRDFCPGGGGGDLIKEQTNAILSGGGGGAPNLRTRPGVLLEWTKSPIWEQASEFLVHDLYIQQEGN